MGAFQVLKNKNYAVLFSGQLVSKLGNNLYLLALPWYVYTVTGSKTALATTAFMQSLPILLGLFAGVYVDRWNKLLTMVVVDALRVILSFMLFAGVVLHAPLWGIIAMVLVLEAVGRFFGPASNSLLPLLVPKAEIAAAQGLNQTTGALAELVAAFGGGVLMQWVGPAYLFLGNAVTYLVSVVSLAYIRYSETLQDTKHVSFFHEWKEGLRLSFLSRSVRSIMVAAMAANFAFAAFGITVTAWVKGPMHGTAATLGIIGTAFPVGVMVGGMLLGKVDKRFTTKSILIIGLLVMGISAALFGVKAKLWWDLPDALLMGFFQGLMNGALGTMMIHLIPAHVRGRVFSTFGSMTTIMTPTGIALYGWLMTQVPLSILPALIAIPVVLSALWLMIPMKDDTERLAQASI